MQPKSEKVLDAARNKLLAYCSLINPKYSIPAHIAKIAHALEAAERGDIKRLIITIPPRHGKSMICSQYFPAWYLGRNPDKYIITATYGQDLSDDFGRKVRDQIKDPYYKLIFPRAALRDDSRASSRFETSAGGTYFSVGVGGPITGRGAHLLLIDDPIKNREDADSETFQRRLIDWFGSVAYSRLMPGGSLVIIMTRWHDEDLVGHALRELDHEHWTKIDLKAIGDDGRPLWPEAYDLETLNKIRKTLGEFDWSCLYQQEPIPKEGVIFKPEWLKPGVNSEGYAGKYMGCDLAISKSQTADRTAFSCWGASYGTPTIYHELETVEGKWSFEDQIKRALELHEKYKFDLVGVEIAGYQPVFLEELQRRGIPAVGIRADVDKVRRAHTVSHVYSQGRVRINTEALRRQMLKFRGENEKNDMVDAAVHCNRLMLDYSSENIEKPKDRYAGLDARSRTFWEMMDKEKGFNNKSPEQDFADVFN